MTQADVAQVEQAQAVQVGVELPRLGADAADWLADGGAFETAGAHALWVDADAAAELDPLAMAAALAAVTYRSLLVLTLPEAAAPDPALVRTLATIARLSGGRLRIQDRADTNDGADTNDDGETTATAGTSTQDDTSMEIVVRDLAEDEPASPQRWLRVPSPDSRAAWRATTLDAVGRGYARVVVPANPRLLDILRNPEEPGERVDLHLAQG